jgi:hypothetical protein
MVLNESRQVKVDSSQHPYYVRFFLLVGASSGQVPLTLAGILKGRPCFRWLSFGTLLSCIALALACYNAYQGFDQFVNDVKGQFGQLESAAVIPAVNLTASNSTTSEQSMTKSQQRVPDAASIYSKGIAFSSAGLNYLVNIVLTFIHAARNKRKMDNGFSTGSLLTFSNKNDELVSMAFIVVFVAVASIRATGHAVLAGLLTSKGKLWVVFRPLNLMNNS